MLHVCAKLVVGWGYLGFVSSPSEYLSFCSKRIVDVSKCFSFVQFEFHSNCTIKIVHFLLILQTRRVYEKLYAQHLDNNMHCVRDTGAFL